MLVADLLTVHYLFLLKKKVFNRKRNNILRIYAKGKKRSRYCIFLVNSRWVEIKRYRRGRNRSKEYRGRIKTLWVSVLFRTTDLTWHGVHQLHTPFRKAYSQQLRFALAVYLMICWTRHVCTWCVRLRDGNLPAFSLPWCVWVSSW